MKQGRQTLAYKGVGLPGAKSSSVRGTDAPARPSVAQRVRYRLDNAFSRGPTAVIIWLASVTLTIILLAAFFLALFRVRINSKHASFLEAFWQSLLRILDTGTVASDSGWTLRVTALIVTLCGIFLASALIGIIAAAIDHKLQDLRRGRSFVIEHGHTLVLGWSPRIFTILSEICVANENHPGACIVVLSPVEKPEMEEEIRSRVGFTRRTRIVCRTGDPARLHDLAIANTAHARSIIVLGDVDEPAGDAPVVKAVLATLIANPDPEVPIVAELNDPETARALQDASQGRVRVVRAADVIARITAQACRQSGLSAVCQELLDFDGDEIYFQAVPELEGQTFGDALLAFEESSVIGIQVADGTTRINPPMDTRFGAGDSVIAVSEDDDTVIFSGLQPAPATDAVLEPQRSEVAQRILVVGWNPLGPVVLEELDAFVPAGSSADVLVDDELVSIGELTDLELQRVATRFLPCGGDMEQLNQQLDEHHPPYDHVIILGYRGNLAPSEADARTLLTLLLLHRSRGSNRAARVVAEVLDSRDVELAQATGADDFIVSDALSSHMMAQLAENPHLDAVFTDLFDAVDSAIGVKPARWYVRDEGRVPFAQIVAAARERGEVAIGYRKVDTNGSVVSVNPAKSESVSLGEKDRVVVIGVPE